MPARSNANTGFTLLELLAAPAVARRAKGFTLVELLVVISIIALLISIIIPTLSGAMERARQITCSNIQRQTFIGIKLYADDNDGSLVPHFTDPGVTWQTLLTEDGYLGVDPATYWTCPSADFVNSIGINAVEGSPTEKMFRHPYVENLENIPSPADVIALTDAERISISGTPPFINAPERHRGAAVYAFCDGHTAVIPAQEMEPPEGAAGTLGRWTSRTDD